MCNTLCQSPSTPTKDGSFYTFPPIRMWAIFLSVFLRFFLSVSACHHFSLIVQCAEANFPWFPWMSNGPPESQIPIHCHPRRHLTDGSTAVTALLLRDRLYIANLGPSLCRGGKPGADRKFSWKEMTTLASRFFSSSQKDQQWVGWVVNLLDLILIFSSRTMGHRFVFSFILLEYFLFFLVLTFWLHFLFLVFLHHTF